MRKLLAIIVALLIGNIAIAVDFLSNTAEAMRIVN